MAVVLALVGAVVGEFIGASKGLGALVIASQGTMDTALMFAVLALIAVLGLAVYQATLLVERWLLLPTRTSWEETPHAHHRPPPARGCTARHLRLLGQQGARLDKLTVAGWSKPITEVMPLLVHEDKDFYRAQGIDLAYVPGAGSADAIRNILGGQADVAFADPGTFFAAIDKGEKLRAIYDIYPQNVFNVVALKGSNIARPSDLKGKKIGVYSLASGTRQALQVLLHTAGLSESDVTVVVTGLLNFAPLMQGQVDATAATDTGLLIGQRRGLPGERDRGGPVPAGFQRPVRGARGNLPAEAGRAAALPARLPRCRELDDGQAR